jgi:hypothetical protein
MTGMLVAVLWGAMLAPASGQSLGEVARKEAARREKIKSSGKVLTNADLPASAVLQPSTPEAAPDTAEGSAVTTPSSQTGGEKPADASNGTTTAAPKDDEEGWRQRAATVNKAVSETRAQVRQLQALSDRLALEMQVSNAAIAARATSERQDVRSQLAAAETRESEAAATRVAFEQEARRAGVPPAWIQ